MTNQFCIHDFLYFLSMTIIISNLLMEACVLEVFESIQELGVGIIEESMNT
jgi:hypothetical protein